MKNFTLLTTLSLAIFVSSVFADNDMSEKQQKLCKLRKYASARLKILSQWDPKYCVDEYLSRAIKQTSASEFDWHLNAAKASIERDINLFGKFHQDSVNELEKLLHEEKFGACFEVNIAAKTWLQLKTYFTEGQRPMDFSFLEKKTEYQQCSDDLSAVKYWKNHTAELEKQIKVLKKIKAGLDECVSSEPTAQVN